MQIEIYRLNECEQAKGLCVVIDVLRAFTTAAFAFAAGAKEIFLVSTVEEAFALQKRDPATLLMGELGGLPIPGFHFGNSPFHIQPALLEQRRLVQRTSAGTQGVVRCRHAEKILVSSFVVADATLRRIREINPTHVSLIVTGSYNGEEDLALAKYLKESLEGKNPSIEPFLEEVKSSPEGRQILDPQYPQYPPEDLGLAVSANQFDFAMEVFKEAEDLVARVQFPSR